MNLFVINSSPVQEAFFTVATTELAHFPVGLLWINGRRENNDWFSYNPNRNPIYSGLDWVQTDNIDGRTSGDCLRYSQEHGPYQPKGENCDRTSWFSCEFYDEPVAEPNTEICWAENSIVDANGNYLKTSCIVSRATTPDIAESICEENGMILFNINNSTVQTSFFETTTASLAAQPGGFLWINGFRENDEWFVNTTRRLPLYEDIDWLESPVDGRTSGDFLLYTSQFGRYQAMGETGSRTAWFICEY